MKSLLVTQTGFFPLNSLLQGTDSSYNKMIHNKQHSLEATVWYVEYRCHFHRFNHKSYQLILKEYEKPVW